MCGFASLRYKEKNIMLSLGNSGGLLQVGDVEYSNDDGELSRSRMEECLNTFSKEELTELLLVITQNGEEG